jgi:cytochrome b561
MRPVSSTVRRYDLPTIWFHWTVAVLVLVQWVIAQVIDWFPQGMPRVEARSVHISLGLCLGVLLAARILWRATRGRVLPPADRGVLQTLAKIVHYALYALLIAMVLVGIFLVYVRGDNFFGLFTVPAFDPNNKALRDNVGELHGTIATIILILAGLHASAGLIHHYLRHDGVLRRMLPSGN